MRIQHNIMAMSAYRNYTNNVSAMKKNLEKLSSGYKINRAGDDAAGLAISEKMRAQITGLETAQKNAKDGISLVQTAEGALTEVHDMLNRMVELASMSANGTYDDDTDRAQLQKEMDQLTEEINRIADSANFNGIKLLDGSMDGAAKLGEMTGLTAASAVADGDQDGAGGTPGVYSIDLNDLTLKIGTTMVKGSETVTHTGVQYEKTPAQFTTASTKYYDSDGNTVASAADPKFDHTTKVMNKTADAVMDTKTTTTTLSVAQLKIGAGDITFQVGKQSFMDENGQAIDVSTAITDGSKAGAQIAAALDGSTITIDNITYDVTGANGKITLTAQTAPTADLAVKLDVDFKPDAGIANGNIEGQNNGWDMSVHVLTPATVAGDTKLAQGKFTLTTDMIKNGSALQIGKETYLFQVGDDEPITAGSGQTVIKLSESDGVKEAAQKLSKMNNSQFHITANEVDGEIRLTEKAGAVDYKTDYDLKNTAGDTADADWSKVVKTGKLAASSNGAKALRLQIGDTAETFNQLKVNISDCHADALGIGTSQISIADQDSAAEAIDKIKAAINKVSDVRGTLGATQNRLDHTINNLSVMTENIQDAESTIRDVDVAEEMMAYTKNNILIQSAQAMLAQANQVPQGVLQLLQ